MFSIAHTGLNSKQPAKAVFGEVDDISSCENPAHQPKSVRDSRGKSGAAALCRVQPPKAALRVEPCELCTRDCKSLLPLNGGSASLPPAEFSAGGFLRRKWVLFLFQLQKFGGVHRRILTADAEMDVGAHHGFHQGGIPGIADGLPHGYGVSGTDAQLLL